MLRETLQKNKRSEEYHWKKNGYDQARALGMTLILEKLSNAGEKRQGSCFCSE